MHRYARTDYPVITVAGAPYQRGVQYGKLAAAQIRHTVHCYAMLFAHDCGLNWSQIQTLAEDYLPILETHTPELLAEMHGIATGAGHELAEIVALNARTELLARAAATLPHPDYPQAQQHNQASGLKDPIECTLIAALPGATQARETLLAQTWDWISPMQAGCVVLRIASDTHPDILTLTEAGMLAKIGLNRAGVGVGLNILRSTSDGQQPGLPIHVLLRRALMARSTREAVAALRQVPPTASSCITVADDHGHVASVELTPHATRTLTVAHDLFIHTNHCLTDAPRQQEKARAPDSTTLTRYARATHLAQAAHGSLSVARLQTILRDEEGYPHCICWPPNPDEHPADRTQTLAGVVLELRTRTLHLASGRPVETEFVPLTF